MKNGQPFKKDKIPIAAAIVIAVFCSFMLARFFLVSHASLDREIKTGRLKLAKYRVLLKKQDLFRDSLTLLSGSKQERAIGILSELERLAKADTVKISDMRPENREGKSLSITLKTTAKLENYLRLLYHLEHSGLPVSVSRLQLGARPGTNELDAACVLDASYTD